MSYSLNSINLTRRQWLVSAGMAGMSVSGWLERLAAATAADKKRKRACILLWMNGGPSQMDTFDLKPGHKNGGPFKEIDTAVPGIRISEHLPRVAARMKKLAVIRSMSTKEADHGRATYLMRTGRVPGGAIQYPTMGSFFAKELEDKEAELPSFVSIAPNRFLSPAAYGPGFLGSSYAPLVVGASRGFGVVPNQNNAYEQQLKVQDLDTPSGIDASRAAARVALLGKVEKQFLKDRADHVAVSHRTAYERAVTMMASSAVKAFDLSTEPGKLRDAYGRNLFGQGCLLARKLVEEGVPFVEVNLAGVNGGALGWDTHQNNFDNVLGLSEVLDPAWAALMDDLEQRGLLDSTMIVWMGEFGRTPRINGNKGRDHWARSWSTVLGGGGIKGGQVVGKTSADGITVENRPVAVADLLATVGLGLGIDIRKENMSNVGRPIRLVEADAKPIREVLS